MASMKTTGGGVEKRKRGKTGRFGGEKSSASSGLGVGGVVCLVALGVSEGLKKNGGRNRASRGFSC